MSSTIVVLVAVVLAVGYLAFLAVSALRARGAEEIPANLKPGIPDDELETRRLERAQQAAVVLSAFLALALPLYYLGETGRQEAFTQQFDEESVTRGQHLVEEFKCFGCHGPNGVGGAAPFVEKRTGVNVSWAAPSLNDVLYRYTPDEVTYWITYGRGNTPMPPWGTAGGGPMNEQQVQDIVHYLQSIQIPNQIDVVAKSNDVVRTELAKLAGADAALEEIILKQRQLIADLEAAPTLAPIARELADRAEAALEGASEGIDTDGDGLSDVAEQTITDITHEAERAFALPGLEPITFDPTNPASTGVAEREAAEALVATLEELAATRAPIITPNVEAIKEALAQTEGDDSDLDTISDEAEQTITAQLAAAVQAVKPAGLEVVDLDPANPESVGGESDARAARRAVGELSTLALNLGVQAENLPKLLDPAKIGLERLLQAQQERRWEIDIQGVADIAFDGDLAKAERAVGIFQGYCARCHTSGYSAGIPFAQEPGAGGFGPALWVGRPNVQFLEEKALPVAQFLTVEDLADFLLTGPRANKPYGVNGFGSGRMPAFGKILSRQDLELLATYLRSGNLNGKR